MMNTMRTFADALALGAALLFAPFAAAQGWPEKPLHLVVAFPPGGPADLVARLIAPKLEASLGQPVIVENRGGSGGNIAAAAVARSAPDGYTALLTTSSFAVNMSLFRDPGYDAERDFAATAIVVSQPNLIVVNPSLPVKTLGDLIALAHRSKLAYASPGIGTSAHLTAEHLFHALAKLDIVTVQFRGAGPAIAAVLAGEPPIGCLGVGGPLAQVRAGRLRALAVSSAERIPMLPEVPTLAEAGFPVAYDVWFAVFVPAATPTAINQKWNDAIDRALEDREIRDKLALQAFVPVGGSLRQAADYLRAEIAKWKKVVEETGVKPE